MLELASYEANPGNHQLPPSISIRHSLLTGLLFRCLIDLHKLLQRVGCRRREVPAHLDRAGALLLELQHEVLIIVQAEVRSLEEIIIAFVAELHHNLPA